MSWGEPAVSGLIQDLTEANRLMSRVIDRMMLELLEYKVTEEFDLEMLNDMQKAAELMRGSEL